MIRLANERLTVEIAEPGTAYAGPRYDWCGFITGVTLDESHTFCAPESLEAGVGSGGVGLCNEFGIFDPIGYYDALPGEQFPKLGVGLLTKIDNERYNFGADYPFTPFPVQTRVSPDSVEFITHPLPCRGYAARLIKRISLDGNYLSIAYELSNTGEKPLHTNEYNHNFVTLNGHVPGPDYSLRLAEGIHLRDVPLPLQLAEDEVQWTHEVASPLLVLSTLDGRMDSTGVLWELRHRPSGAGMSERLDSPIVRMALWCAPHLVSPEIFVDINIAPGETRRWTRRYEFFCEPTRNPQ